MSKHEFHYDTPVGKIGVEVSGSEVTILVDEQPRVGVIYDEPDCDDPTVVIWNNNDGDDTVVALHLGKLDWNLPSFTLARHLADEARTYF